jgi:hypothetical protein
MPKVDSITKKRGWLKAYEQGQSEAAIAKEAHRDVRTIKRGIEEAKREQVSSVARAELLKEALRNHHETLLSLINEMLLVLKLPPANQPIPWESAFSPGSIRIDGGTAKYEYLFDLEVTSITLDVEDKIEWELIREHLKRDPFLEALNQWEKALASHLTARMIMKRKLATLLKEKTGYAVLKDVTEGSFIYLHSIDFLFGQMLMAMTQLGGIEDLKGSIKVEHDSGDIRYGSGTSLAHVPGVEQACMNSIIEVLDELLKSLEAKSVLETRRVCEELTAKVRRAAAEICMTGLLSGQCRVCRRLGI